MASGTKNEESQLSLSRLFFIIGGIAICFGFVPSLPRIGPITPSLSPFFAVVLMFGWAMIAVRRGSRRVWWIGFVISGVVYMSAVILIGGPAIHRVGEVSWSISQHSSVAPYISWDVIEACSATAMLFLLIALLFGVGACGGISARAMFERWWPCEVRRTITG